MKGKEGGLLASENRIEEKLVHRSPTSAHRIHSKEAGGFSIPQTQPGFFLGKDRPLCSLFVLDFFTLFPIPGAPSLPPFLSRLLSAQWMIRKGKGRIMFEHPL